MFDVLAMLVLLGIGVRLSAFFSGAETGFYRLSLPRLGIDARAGDRPAMRLLWFTQHPALFVATCLVGNNIANYLTTGAVSWAVVLMLGHSSEVSEVVATLLFAPFLFLAGEVVPKSLYYQIPYSRLRKDIGPFTWVYRVCVPVTWPLVQITRQLERWTGQGNQPVEIVLGRNRLVQLMHHGKQEGVLTDIQSRLANGLLQLAPQPAVASLMPAARVFGTSETATRDDIMKVARSYGVSVVAIHSKQSEDWYGYVRVRDVIASPGKPLIRKMPQISVKASKLEALNLLRLAQAPFGVIIDEGESLGLISRQGLVEQLFRPEPTATARLSV